MNSYILPRDTMMADNEGIMAFNWLYLIQLLNCYSTFMRQLLFSYFQVGHF